MLSTRKDEVKTTLLTFFPKVLTTIIADYSEPDFSELKKFSEETKAIEKNLKKKSQYFIAEALLQICENPSKDKDLMEYMRCAITSCYKQNRDVVFDEELPRFITRLEETRHDASYGNYEYFIIPKKLTKPIPSIFYNAYITEKDALHDILVSLYTQCDGDTTESEALRKVKTVG